MIKYCYNKKDKKTSLLIAHFLAVPIVKSAQQFNQAEQSPDHPTTYKNVCVKTNLVSVTPAKSKWSRE